MTVSFNVSYQDFALIEKIVDRAGRNDYRDPLDIYMDLAATHANGCPLDFAKLLAFDDFNLAHDIMGIARHLDRNTGKLMDCFRPRCSRPNAAS